MIERDPSWVVVAATGVTSEAMNAVADMTMAALRNNFLTPPLSRI